MSVIFVSAFRNMSGRVRRYLHQVDSLQLYDTRVIAVEGDSTDNTRHQLTTIASSLSIPLTLVTHNHGQRVFASTEDSTRLTALTGVMKTAMWTIGEVAGPNDIVVYVESDLLWDSSTISRLISLQSTSEFDIIAPMVFAGEAFYDIWGFRKNGTRFTPLPPYHPDLSPTGLTEVDSVGSCLVFRAPISREVTPIGDLGLVSWCAGARAAGLHIATSPELRISHP